MTTTILVLHALAAALATWRLTELIALDKVAEPLRRRLPRWYLLTCVRCLSVWMGILTTLAFAFVPWLNWPLALSWLYLWRLESVQLRRQSAQANEATLRALKMADDARKRFAGQWPGQPLWPPQPMEINAGGQRADV